MRTRSLFGAWGALGFRRTPPNGALVIDGGRRSADTIALELRLRSYRARTRTARFAARALPGLGHGLTHLNRRLDRSVPSAFRGASLFVDNASIGDGCVMGQPQLFATTLPIEDALPADGRLLSIRAYSALFALYGSEFGGDRESTFALPTLSAPAGMQWVVCTQGFFPSSAWLGPCTPGEIDYRALPAGAADGDAQRVPADGRALSVSEYPMLAALLGAPGEDTFNTPVVAGPPGLTALICAAGVSQSTPALARVDLFVNSFPADYVPADGRVVPISPSYALYALMDNAFGGSQSAGTFAFPNVPGPAPGIGYGVATEGTWPAS